MKKRFLSIILTIAIILGNIPLLSFGASGVSSNEQQVEYAGGWNNENPMPENKGANSNPYETTGELYKDRIAVSKTIAATDVENYFDITLKIVAKQRVIDQSVDVVLVLDNSNTMNGTHQNLYPGDVNYNLNDARITHGKKAVSQFIDKFAADQNISQERRLGVVTFNSYANTVLPLQTVNTTAHATSVKSALNSITAPTEDRVRFTNIEGGLQLAYNLLSESDAVYKYVIFVTDGFPTTYIESGRDSKTQIVGYDTFVEGSYDESKLNDPGYFADSVTKQICSYGVSYSDIAADKADDMAETIKNAGINIFSIGIDVGVQSIPEFIKRFEGSAFTIVDRRTENHVIGSETSSYRKWLSESIAGGTLIDKASSSEEIHRYAEGNSQEQLETAFNNILKDIELIPAETMQEAYTIDPMSDYVEFLNFYNDFVDGGKVDKITHTTTGADVATYDEATKAIKWWLANTQSWSYDENTGNYELYIRYRVRLKNEAEGFNPSTAFPTNDTTTFYFKTTNLEDGTPLYGDNSIDYRIPEVEGYLGELVFIKKDSVTGNPLSGAEFELHHDVDSCDICHAGGAEHSDRPVIPAKTATSGADGKVVFDKLPSGHEYVLTEKKAPTGYQPGTNHTVMVAYGKTTLHGHEVSAENPGVVENDKIVHAEAVLKAKKTMVGRDFEEEEFTFALDGVRMNGLEYHERHHINAEGEVEFEKIIFDREGTFTFKVSELKGNDPTVIYDDTVYTVVFDVKLNDEGTAYVLTTKVDGKDIDNDSAPDPFVFTNNLREKGKVQLRATKYMDDKAPADGAFTFKLEDENNNELQVKSNVGKDIIFDEIQYDKEDVYTYYISEVHVDDEDIFCDHTVYTAKVTVTAPEDDGAFETKVEYYVDETKSDEAVFNNRTRTPAKLTIQANKTMNGTAPQDNRFTFELRDEAGNLIGEAKENDANGTITFDTLEFSDSGLTYYTINEVAGTDKNVIYDRVMYRVYVVTEMFHNTDKFLIDVTVAKATGRALEQVYRIKDANEAIIQVGDGIDFANKNRDTASVQLSGNKLFNGKAPENEKFKFELRKKDGTFVESVENDAEGNYTFSKITYDTAGTYEYTVTEVAGTDKGIIYDATSYDVTVDVTHPDNTDYYVAKVTVGDTVKEDKDVVVDNLDFNNRSREKAQVILTAEKTLDGETPGKNDVFLFELENDEDVIEGVDNDGGSVTFSPLYFDKEGTYTYKIREIKENEFFVYDESVYDVTITVTTPDDDSAFVADVSYTKNGEAYEGVPLFENQRKVEETDPEETDPEETDPEETEPEETKPEDTDGKDADDKGTDDNNTGNNTTTPDVTTDVPKTGDNANLMLWIVLLFVSGGIFAKIILPDNKKKTK